MEGILYIILQTIRISMPYMMAAAGGVFSERGGVINIALEGIILNSSFCAVLGTYYTGSPVAGVAAGVAGGIITSLIHAVACLEYSVDHIISGIAVNIFSFGMTKYFLLIVFGSSSNSPRITPLGKIGLSHNLSISPLVPVFFILVLLSYFVIFRTRFGLRLRSCGEHPEAADTMGVNVKRTKYAGVLISGALAGLAGVWLAMDQSQFTAGMSGGRGFIALAAVIFGKWNPAGAAAAALLFGAAECLQIQLQTSGIDVPAQFIQMLPYLITIIVLAGMVGRSRPPAAAGKNYPEEYVRGEN